MEPNEPLAPFPKPWRKGPCPDLHKKPHVWWQWPFLDEPGVAKAAVCKCETTHWVSGPYTDRAEAERAASLLGPPEGEESEGKAPDSPGSTRSRGDSPPDSTTSSASGSPGRDEESPPCEMRWLDAESTPVTKGAWYYGAYKEVHGPWAMDCDAFGSPGHYLGPFPDRATAEKWRDRLPPLPQERRWVKGTVDEPAPTRRDGGWWIFKTHPHDSNDTPEHASTLSGHTGWYLGPFPTREEAEAAELPPVPSETPGERA